MRCKFVEDILDPRKVNGCHECSGRNGGCSVYAEVERLRALIFSDEFDHTKLCMDKYHDQRWCERCEVMGDGIDLYQQWLRDAAGRGEGIC